MPDLLAGGQPEDAELFIRPERIGIRQAPDAEGMVVSTSFLGSIQRVQVLWRSQPLLVETSSAVGLAAGDRVTLSLTRRTAHGCRHEQITSSSAISG
jgi:iron(III) transport system ATP-binding protein